MINLKKRPGRHNALRYPLCAALYRMRRISIKRYLHRLKMLYSREFFQATSKFTFDGYLF